MLYTIKICYNLVGGHFQICLNMKGKSFSISHDHQNDANAVKCSENGRRSSLWCGNTSWFSQADLKLSQKCWTPQLAAKAEAFILFLRENPTIFTNDCMNFTQRCGSWRRLPLKCRNSGAFSKRALKYEWNDDAFLNCCPKPTQPPCLGGKKTNQNHTDTKTPQI